MTCRHLMWRWPFGACQLSRGFSSTSSRKELRDITELPDRTHPAFQESKNHELLSLKWPSPPQNILFTKKDRVPNVTASLIECAKHVHSTYPSISLILEPHAAKEVHQFLPFPVFTLLSGHSNEIYASKVDLVATLGGDGTILHASALFSSSPIVPPMLSFSMGTLGFLGEWKFSEYKRAFREVYMSGARAGYGSVLFDDNDESAAAQAAAASAAATAADQYIAQDLPKGWSSLRGKSMGTGRPARVLLRNRLKVQIFSPEGKPLTPSHIYAMNEVNVHRGRSPHLATVDILIGGRFLTSAVADGMIVSTPTGSTAYSLSSGGSIVHPLVSALALTPICPRSLSFRPLVLPARSPVSLRLSDRNRSKEVEVSIDGQRRNEGLAYGMEIKIWGEPVKGKDGFRWGGVPSIVRSGGRDDTGEDHWVGGLNGLLKFNYPFGEDGK